MAQRSARRVALMSIHPEYAEALLDGTKTVELRRSRFANDISHILIYATSPVQKVLGWAKTGPIKEGSPTRIWETHKGQAGISRSTYRAYFQGSRRAIAIHVMSPQWLPTPLSLSEIDDGLQAPQSWRYLSLEAAQRAGIPA